MPGNAVASRCLLAACCCISSSAPSTSCFTMFAVISMVATGVLGRLQAGGAEGKMARHGKKLLSLPYKGIESNPCGPLRGTWKEVLNLDLA